MEFFVVVGMIVVGKDNILVEMEKNVVETKIVDMVDMMFEDCREDGFQKRFLSNLVKKVDFEPTEEVMPAKENECSICFVHNLD